MIEFKNLRHVKLWKLVSFGLRVFILLRIGILKNFDCLVIIVILLGWEEFNFSRSNCLLLLDDELFGK